MSVKVNSVVVGPLEVNCYVVSGDSGSGKCFIIDPGANGNRIVNYIRNSHLIPEVILLTHGHFDHTCAIDWVLREFPRTRILALDEEKEVLDDPGKSLIAGIGRSGFLKEVEYIKDGDILQPAGITVKVIATPGHTKGSCCYYLGEDHILFSGDTLFRESCGRTDLPTGSDSAIRSSVREKLMVLPENTAVYPGHGEASDIGHEKATNFIMLGF